LKTNSSKLALGFKKVVSFYKAQINEKLIDVYEPAFDGKLKLLLLSREGEVDRISRNPENGLLTVIDGNPQIGSRLIGAKEIGELYNKYGVEKTADMLDGGWIIVFVDEINDQIFILRDRIGLKPFYYCWKNGILIAASNAGAIVKSGWIPAVINTNIVTRYSICHYRAIYGHDESFFNDIFLLQPAHILALNKSKLVFKKYWDLNPDESYLDIPEKELTTLYRKKLIDTMMHYLDAWGNDKNAVALSGGIDSGTIVGLMHKVLDERIDAISMTYDENTDFDETYLIQCSVKDHVAKWHNIQLNSQTLLSDLPNLYSRFDIPFATISIYGFNYLFREAVRRGYNKIFTGNGGDQLNGGNYSKFLYVLADYNIKYPELYNHELKCWIKNHSTTQYPKTQQTVEDFFKKAIYLNEPGKLREHQVLLHNNVLANYANTTYESLNIRNVKSYGDFLRTYTMQEYRYDAIAPGAESEEMIDWIYNTHMVSPLLSKDIIEFGWLIPIQHKVKNGLNKIIARTSLRGICNDRILDRVATSGFNAPFDLWIKGALHDFVMDTFSSNKFKSRNIYNLGKFKKVLNEHLNDEKNHMMFLWQALNLELWFREWIDG